MTPELATWVKDLKRTNVEDRWIPCSVFDRNGIGDTEAQRTLLRREIPPAKGYDWQNWPAHLWRYTRAGHGFVSFD